MKVKTLMTLFLIGLGLSVKTSAQNLLGYYTFVSGNATDVSSNANDGTVNSVVSCADKLGNPNRALRFNAGNVALSPAVFANLNDYTYSLWVRIDTVQQDSFRTIFSIGTSVADQFIYVSNLSGSKGFGFTSYAQTSPVTADEYHTSTSLPPTTVWTHIVLTRNTSTSKLKFYINGVLQNGSGTTISNSTAAYGTPTYDAYIGRRSGTAPQYFKGDIDDVRIYDGALSDQQVQDIYNNEKIRPSLIGHFAFTGNNGDDISGNGYSGSTFNTTSTTDRFGNNNRAIHFSGSSVSLPPTPYILNDYTYSLWVKIDSVQQDSFRTIFSIGTSVADQFIYVSNLSGSKGFGFTSYAQTSPVTANEYHTSTSLPPTTVWTHIVLTRNTSTSKLKFYINGVLQNGSGTTISNSTAAYGTPTYDAYIGRRAGTSPQYFKGDIDDVRIYNGALSDAEVLSLYNTPITDAIRTGLNDIKKRDDLLSIYPNPSNGTVFISSNSQIYSLKLLNAQGKVVYSVLNPSSTFEISSLSVGIYFCEVEGDGYSKKILKLIVSE